MGYKQFLLAKGGINQGNTSRQPSTVTHAQDCAGGYRPNQPSQKYKFTPNQPPRIDNSNQPWYGSNDRSWGRTPGETQTSTLGVNDDQGATNYNLTSFWDVLNSFFKGGQTPKSNLTSTQDVYSPDGQIVDPANVGNDQNSFMRRGY